MINGNKPPIRYGFFDAVIVNRLMEAKSKKEIFKNELMNLIQTNHQINITSDHSVSTNNSFKSHLNSKSFNMFLTL